MTPLFKRSLQKLYTNYIKSVSYVMFLISVFFWTVYFIAMLFHWLATDISCCTFHSSVAMTCWNKCSVQHIVHHLHRSRLLLEVWLQLPHIWGCMSPHWTTINRELLLWYIPILTSHVIRLSTIVIQTVCNIKNWGTRTVSHLFKVWDGKRGIENLVWEFRLWSKKKVHSDPLVEMLAWYGMIIN
jgi:hypothetical protein